MSIWKTYFMSKLIYPIIALILLTETATKKIMSQTSMAMKKCMGINQKLKKEKLFGWLYELTPIELAELTLLRILKKLVQIEMRIENHEFYLQKLSSIPKELANEYINGDTTKQKLKDYLLTNRSQAIGLKNGKPLEFLQVSDIEWMKFGSGELDLYRWKDKTCALCTNPLSTDHLLMCDGTLKLRKEIEMKTGKKADIALKDPTLFNSREKRERTN